MLSGVRKFAAQCNSDSIAIYLPEDGGDKISYKMLIRMVDNLTEFIKANLNSGGVVGLKIPNGIQYVIILLALISANISVIPINPTLKKEETERLLLDVNAYLIMTCHYCNEVYDKVSIARTLYETHKGIFITFPKTLIKHVTSSVDEEPILLLPTSGTTSIPKIVPMHSSQILSSVTSLIKAYDLKPTDCTIALMPLFHGHGLVGSLLTTLFSGGTIVLPPRFSVTGFPNWLKDYPVTWISAVPTIYQMILNSNDNLEIFKGNLRFVRTCSARLTEQLSNDLHKVFNVPVLQAYGITEACHVVSTETLTYKKNGSVGKPMNCSVKIENFEICIKGPSVIKQYYKNTSRADAFTEDLYFRTRDLGHFDEEGFLYVDGRIKEIINRGGEKISPHEVEEAIMKQIPDVREVYAFGYPDKVYGERLACIIVLAPSSKGIEEKDLKEKLQDHLALFKIPEKIIITEIVPKSVTGKISRSNLATLYSL